MYLKNKFFCVYLLRCCDIPVIYWNCVFGSIASTLQFKKGISFEGNFHGEYYPTSF